MLAERATLGCSDLQPRAVARLETPRRQPSLATELREEEEHPRKTGKGERDGKNGAAMEMREGKKGKPNSREQKGKGYWNVRSYQDQGTPKRWQVKQHS